MEKISNKQNFSLNFMLVVSMNCWRHWLFTFTENYVKDTIYYIYGLIKVIIQQKIIKD